jgi:hypothetical protein
VKLLVMGLSGLATALHQDLGSTSITALATDLADLLVLGYGIYIHWNMKKVPEIATAVQIDGKAQPIGSTVVPGVVKVVGALLIGFVIIHSVPVSAQTKPVIKPKALTATAVKANPVAVLQAFTVGDLQAALADAQAQTPPDTVSAACYSALIPIVQSGVGNPLPTGLGAFQALQKARDAQTFVANLNSPTGPLSGLNTACAPLVLSVQNTLVILGVVGGAVVGTGGLALPFGLPAIGALAIP